MLFIFINGPKLVQLTWPYGHTDDGSRAPANKANTPTFVCSFVGNFT